VIDVVRKPDGDAPRCGALERAADDVREPVGQADVVDRDLERPLRV
jgi:hypothetical protein